MHLAIPQCFLACRQGLPSSTKAFSHIMQTHRCCLFTSPPQSEEASTSSSDTAPEPQDSTEAAAAATPSSSGRARHVSLDDPVLNIYLRYNTSFMMDPDREYKIGQRNAFEKKTRLELRKALAAHRLHLRDVAAAAASGSKHQQRSLAQQMSSRLVEMQAYITNPSGF